MADESLSAIRKEFDGCREYRRSAIEDIWKANHDMYCLAQDDQAGMQDFQDKDASARFAISVDVIAQAEWDMVVNSGEELFDIRFIGPADPVKELISYALKRRVWYHLNQENFYFLLLEALKSVKLYGVSVFKAPMEIEAVTASVNGKDIKTERWRQRLSIIEPQNVYFDYTRCNRFMFTRYFVSKRELVYMAQVFPEKYDRQVAENAETIGTRSSGTEGLDLEVTAPNSDDLVAVTEIWGDIPQEAGKDMLRKHYAAFIGNEFITAPRPLVSWTGIPPVCVSSDSIRPFEEYPIPYSHYFWATAKRIDEALRKAGDQLSLINLPPCAVNLDMIDPMSIDSEEIEIYPGMVLGYHGEGSPMSFITPPGIDRSLFDFIQTQLYLYSFFGDNEVMHGAPQQHSRTSAAEIASQQSGQGRMLANKIRMMEYGVIKPLVRMVMSNVLQYEQPEIWLPYPGADEEILQRAMQVMVEPEFRFILVNAADLTVTGATESAKRYQDASMLLDLVRWMVENPAAGDFMVRYMRIHPNKLGMETLQRLGLNRANITMTEAEYAQLLGEMGQQQQQALTQQDEQADAQAVRDRYAKQASASPQQQGGGTGV